MMDEHVPGQLSINVVYDGKEYHFTDEQWNYYEEWCGIRVAQWLQYDKEVNNDY